MAELSGDIRLTPPQRLWYLAANLVRNLAGSFSLLATRNWTVPPVPLAGYSPGRMYSDHFLDSFLGAMPRRDCDVLEVGCGSCSLCGRLARLGFSGRYAGVDIDDRFDRTPVAGFEKSFFQADATAWTPPRQFDLIVSVSALEHIPDDAAAIARLRGWLRPGGMQVHIVPAAAALPLYLWHGYRQYGRRAVARRFPGATVYRLGGVMSFLVHLLLITGPEMLAGWRLRRHWPAVYRAMLRASRLDVMLGSRPASFYAVVERMP